MNLAEQFNRAPAKLSPGPINSRGCQQILKFLVSLDRALKRDYTKPKNQNSQLVDKKVMIQKLTSKKSNLFGTLSIITFLAVGQKS